MSLFGLWCVRRQKKLRMRIWRILKRRFISIQMITIISAKSNIHLKKCLCLILFIDIFPSSTCRFLNSLEYLIVMSSQRFIIYQIKQSRRRIFFGSTPNALRRRCRYQTRECLSAFQDFTVLIGGFISVTMIDEGIPIL